MMPVIAKIGLAITSFLMLFLSLFLTAAFDSHAFTQTQEAPMNYFKAEGVVTEIDVSEMQSEIVSPTGDDDDHNRTYFELHDWDSQSGKVLFTSGQFIGIMNANATDIQKIILPSELHDELCWECSPVRKALFINNTTIYALAQNNLLIYEITNDALVNAGQYQLAGSITSFDIIRQTNGDSSNNSSDTNFNLVLVDSYCTLWLSDPLGKKISKLYEAQMASDFAVSPDGRKIAFVVNDSIEGHVYLHTVRLIILDIENSSNNKTHQVYEEMTDTTPNWIKWSPDGKLILFREVGGRHNPTATLEAISTDGSYREILYGGLDAPTSYVVSKDGTTILIGVSASKLYRLDLAHPIPEFHSLALVIAALSISSIILAHTYMKNR